MAKKSKPPVEATVIESTPSARLAQGEKRGAGAFRPRRARNSLTPPGWRFTIES
jgi:hypothetical protein